MNDEDKRFQLEDIADFIIDKQRLVSRESDPDFYSDLGYLETQIWEIWKKYSN